MAASGQDQHRESHLISLKVMRLSRPSLVTGQGIFFGATSSAKAASASSSPLHPPPLSPSQGEKPNMSSILTEALSDLSLSQLERVHPPSLTTSVPLVDAHKSDNEGNKSPAPHWEEALNMGNYGVSELLTMPASFGNIYLGETFTSYICANNESTHPVRDVILKAELQTSTSATRFALTDILSQQRQLARPSESSSTPPLSSGPVSSGSGGHIQLLESGKTNEMIVAHEIKELGTHILSCSIQYTTLDGQQKSFRKFYKFQVLNPLSVKTKVNHPASSTAAAPISGGNGSVGSTATGASKSGIILLEALIQNMSGVAMWMERMRFEVADTFTVQDLNVAIEESENSCLEQNAPEYLSSSLQGKPCANIFGEHDYFAPNDVRQYLYVLAPRPGKELLAKSTNVLGKLDILWRTQFGETGRLHTSQLTRKPTPLEEITVQVVKVPEVIRLEEVFSIDIVVKNQTLGSGSGSSLPANQQHQQQVHNVGTDQPLARLFNSNNPQPTTNNHIGGALNPPPLALAKPPAAIARGAAIPPNRPTDAHQQQQQQQHKLQQQQQQHNQAHLSQSSSQTSPAQDQHAMKLMLTGVKQKMGAILLSGPNSRQLGSVPAGGEVRVRLDWFPLTSGIQKIGGIRIVDIISGYTIELDHLTNCFVEHT